jgi:L-threonylcarbamoyladenylate synthase
MRASAVNGDPIRDAAAAAVRGELVVIPTDTVYGIGTRPDDPDATARVFDAKQRRRDLVLPVLVGSRTQAETIASFDARAHRLADDSWPGALTLVLPRTARSREWDLGGDGASVGVRLPSHRLALAVLELAGPLAVTSANRSGEPPARTCAEIERAFGSLVSVTLCTDEPLEGRSSTVVDLTGEVAVVLRAGDISPQRIKASLPPEAPLLDSRPSP